MLSATDAKTKWDAICTSCAGEIGGQADFAGKMNACILQLGIPAFKELAATADRDALQAAFASSGCDAFVKQSAPIGSASGVSPETIQMARQIADSQTPPIGAPAPPPVPTATPTATHAAAPSPMLPILAIVAGGGLLWWLLKSKKKGS